jgi:hypothetical protein
MLIPIASPRTEPEAELERARAQVLLDMRCVRTGQRRRKMASIQGNRDAAAQRDARHERMRREQPAGMYVCANQQ